MIKRLYFEKYDYNDLTENLLKWIQICLMSPVLFYIFLCETLLLTNPQKQVTT